MPLRLTSPTVGLSPTSEQAAAGDVMEPSVSVPTATVQQFDAAAIAEPELEPEGVRSSAYGLRACPPRADQPLEACVERKFAHSVRFVLPSTIAPAARSRRTTNASRVGDASTSASEPAVVCIRSAVSMLSFTSTGMPCIGPRVLPARRSASSDAAMASASGFVSSTARNVGPLRSSDSMRWR